MRFTLAIIIISIFITASLRSQNAPVSTIGRITNAVAANTYPVDITVTGFTNIANFTLSVTFDTTRVHFVSATTNPTLSGMTVAYTHPVPPSTQGKLVFTWTSAVNVSLTNNSSLATMNFTYMTGTGILSWAYSYGSVCRYKSWISGVLTTLNDSPKYLYYINGGISNRAAPVTYVSSTLNPVPGVIPVVVTVNAFTSIGALTLYLEYDPTIITYSGTFSKNSFFGSTFLVGDVSGDNGKRLIVIQWYGGSVSLDNGSTLCTINFNYPSANCNGTTLNWYDNGPSCEYADGSGDVLIDMPQSSYYFNGLIAEGLLNTWTGTVSSAWDNASNWNSCGIPTIAKNVVIPDVSPSYFPIITVAASCKTLKIQSGATVTVGPTGSLTLQGF